MDSGWDGCIDAMDGWIDGIIPESIMDLISPPISSEEGRK